MSKTVVSKFVIRNRQFYFHTVWGLNNFELNITDGKHIWAASADSKLIEKLKPATMTFAEYFDHVRQALTVQDVKGTKYKYELAQGENVTDIELRWKIKIQADEEEFEIRGDLPLSRVSVSQPTTANVYQQIMQRCFDWLIGQLETCETQKKELEAKNDQLQQQRDLALHSFEKLTQDKKQLEIELYQKFLLVLNEKKRKIRELKEEVKNAPKQQRDPAKIKHESDTEDDEVEEEIKGTPVLDYLSQSQASHVTPSLTFNNVYDPTPSFSFDLLEDEKTVKATVRTRRKPGETMSSSSSASDKSQKVNSEPQKAPIAKKPEAPFEPSKLQLTNIVKSSAGKKPVEQSPTKYSSPIKPSVHMEIPRSPMMVSPSPSGKLKKRKVMNSPGEIVASDLFADVD